MRKNRTVELPVNIYNLGKMTEGVFCRIEVPNYAGEDITILLFPTEQQYLSIGRAAHFSIEGTVKTGDLIHLHIKSDDVWGNKIESKHITPTLTHTIIYAQALNISICEVFAHDVTTLADDSVKFKGHFLLSDSTLLKPFKIFTNSYTGERTLDKNHAVVFSLEDGLNFEFDTYYKHDTIDNTSSTYPFLVAVLKTDHTLNEIESIENKLNDLLLLSSFAETKRILCYGKELFTEKYKLATFEKKGTADTPEQFETIIDMQHFESFLQSAYKELNRTPFKQDIIQAIYGLTSRGVALEYSFISLFASLESIITSFKKHNEIDRIFDESEWKLVKDGLKISLRSDSVLKNDSPKRALVYEKLEELNRPSFKHGIGSLINTYKIPLEGLWPIIGKNNEISLLEIRNRLVHGESHASFNPVALHVASIHLVWSIQRIILGLLGWDVENTNIASKKICNHNAFKQVSEMMNMMSIG